MTSSEIVEEILYECHKLGIHKNVMDLAKVYLSEGNSLADAYEKAHREIKQHIQTEKVNL